MTERTMLSLYVRSFSGWDRLREAVAGALGLPMAEVRGLLEEADPAVRLEALASVMGFRLRVELYIDPKRARVPAEEMLAVELARRLLEDVAHHDGSKNPYTYVLVRPSGERFLVEESVDGGDADGLLLDEGPGRMRTISSKETPREARRSKSSTLCVASATGGLCGACRHSNQGIGGSRCSSIHRPMPHSLRTSCMNSMMVGTAPAGDGRIPAYSPRMRRPRSGRHSGLWSRSSPRKSRAPATSKDNRHDSGDQRTDDHVPNGTGSGPGLRSGGLSLALRAKPAAPCPTLSRNPIREIHLEEALIGHVALVREEPQLAEERLR